MCPCLRVQNFIHLDPEKKMINYTFSKLKKFASKDPVKKMKNQTTDQALKKDTLLNTQYKKKTITIGYKISTDISLKKSIASKHMKRQSTSVVIK